MSSWLRPRNTVLAILLLLLAGELGVRVLIDHDSAWNMRLGTAKRFDPVTLFRLKANYEVAPGVHTNERGYLAPQNLSFDKPRDALRVIYLGDSASVQPASAMYPAQVERLLAKEGVPVQTLNAAVPGFDSGKARALFEQEIREYEADFFFVYLGWNDLGQYGPEGLPYKRASEGYEITPMQRAFSQVYLGRFLFALQEFARRRQPAFAEALAPEETRLYGAYYPTHYEENLRAILTLAKQRYPNVAIMNLATLTSDHPTEHEMRTAHFPTGMNKNVRKLHLLVTIYNGVVEKVAREQGVERIDLFRVFDSEEARREFTDSAHMNATGTLRMARTAARVILARQEAARSAARGAAAPGAPAVGTP